MCTDNTEVPPAPASNVNADVVLSFKSISVAAFVSVISPPVNVKSVNCGESPVPTPILVLNVAPLSATGSVEPSPTIISPSPSAAIAVIEFVPLPSRTPPSVNSLAPVPPSVTERSVIPFIVPPSILTEVNVPDEALTLEPDINVVPEVFLNNTVPCVAEELIEFPPHTPTCKSPLPVISPVTANSPPRLLIFQLGV